MKFTINGSEGRELIIDWALSVGSDGVWVTANGEPVIRISTNGECQVYNILGKPPCLPSISIIDVHTLAQIDG